MSTTTTETIPIHVDQKSDSKADSQRREPLKLSGALNGYRSFDVTPVIGREFPEADLKEWLEAPNSDELLRDLAITSKHLNRSRVHSTTDHK